MHSTLTVSPTSARPRWCTRMPAPTWLSVGGRRGQQVAGDELEPERQPREPSTCTRGVGVAHRGGGVLGADHEVARPRTRRPPARPGAARAARRGRARRPPAQGACRCVGATSAAAAASDTRKRLGDDRALRRGQHGSAPDAGRARGGGCRRGGCRRCRRPPSARTSWSARRTRTPCCAAPWTARATPADCVGTSAYDVGGGRRRPAGTTRRGRRARPPSRSATVARALVMVAWTLARLRTMPASAISRSTSRSS